MKTKQQKIVEWLVCRGWKVIDCPKMQVRDRIVLSLYESGGVPYYFIGKSGTVRYGIKYSKAHNQTHLEWVKRALST